MRRGRRSLCGSAAIACIAVTPAVAHAEPLGRPAIAQQTKKAWADWKAEMQGSGWVGLQPRIAKCYAEVAAKPSQEQAVYCAVLDHLTLLDTMSFPAPLRPTYFTTDAVFARLDKAVAQTTPKSERSLFESRLLSTVQETIHKIGESDRARQNSAVKRK